MKKILMGLAFAWALSQSGSLGSAEPQHHSLWSLKGKSNTV